MNGHALDTHMATGHTLALDAAVSIGTVAVLRDGRVAASREVAMRGGVDERYMPAVLDALREAGLRAAELDRVICGAGPGSFTSLRVAGAIAKGIATGAECPLFGVPSLALVVATSTGTVAPGSRWLAALDAMRGEKYLALVVVGEGGRLASVEPLGLASADEARARGAALEATLIGPDESIVCAPHATGVARCLALVTAAGPVDVASWEPVYGRLAEAQARREREGAM